MTTPDPIDAMVPVAAALAVAVADHDRSGVDEVLAPLSRHDLYALAILMAAHVDLDQPIVNHFSPAATLGTAVRQAAKLFDTTPEQILSPSRIRNVTDARGVAMAAARWAGLTSNEVGRHFSRDHSTVLHAVARVGADARLRGASERILAVVGRGDIEEAVS